MRDDAERSSGVDASGASFDLTHPYHETDAEGLGLTVFEFRELLEKMLLRVFPQGKSSAERRQLLANPQLKDLLLAHACAAGCERAWERFVSLYREKLYRWATAMTREEATGRELADSLYADLFGMRQGRDGRRISKLESYAGRGSLEGWLRMVLAQEYVNRYRSHRRLVSFSEAMQTGEGTSAKASDSSSRRDLIERATDAALGALCDQDRFVLAAYYLDEQTLAQIGRTLRLHESSVSRRLEKITSGLRKRIIKELGRAGISRKEAEEMLGVDVRELEIDVREQIAQERPAGPFSG